MMRDLGLKGQRSAGRNTLLAVLSLLVVPSLVLAAKGPLTEKDIPLFPGAKPYTNKADLAELAEAEARDRPYVASLSRRGYTTQATPEEVVAWYQKQLSPAQGKVKIGKDLKPGTTSEVQEEVQFYDFSKFSKTPGLGEERRSRLTKDRPPHPSGKWVMGGSFTWSKGEANGGETLFNVTIDDRSFHRDGFRRETHILVDRTTQKSEAELEAERDEEMDQEHAEKTRKLAGTSLDPAKLGVPVYPGAKHDAAMTKAVRTSMGLDGIAYRTTDSVAAVAGFYGKQPGLSPMGEVMKETAAFNAGCREEQMPGFKRKVAVDCKAQVTIQNPWMNINTGKMSSDTLITVRRVGE